LAPHFIYLSEIDEVRILTGVQEGRWGGRYNPGICP
jgi:hypothetical protein